MTIWWMIHVVLGVLTLATVPINIAVGDSIWPWSLAVGTSSVGFGLLIRRWGQV